MSSHSPDALVQSVVTLLTEAYEGPRDPRESWFVDNIPDAGILGVLKTVSAVEASTSVDGSGARGSTIAANVEHLRWSLANANGTFEGQPFNPNWSESWDLTSADEARWDQLRQSLRADFERARQFLLQQPELPGEYITGVLALVPHAAYHLGTIRQMIAQVRGQTGR